MRLQKLSQWPFGVLTLGPVLVVLLAAPSGILATTTYGVSWSGETIAGTDLSAPAQQSSTFDTGGFLNMTSFSNALSSSSSGAATGSCLAGDVVVSCTFETHASSSVSGTASLGSLAFGSSSSASSVETILGLGGAGPFSASGVGSVIESWQDTITITDPGVAAGTALQFLVSLSLADTVSAASVTCPSTEPAGATVTANSSFQLPAIQLISNNCQPFSGMATAVWTVSNGGVYTIGTTLQAGTNAHAGSVNGVPVETSSALADPPLSAFNLDPITAGAFYTSASGMNYGSSTVPEPSSLTLLSSGVAFLAFLACWRRRSRLISL